MGIIPPMNSIQFRKYSLLAILSLFLLSACGGSGFASTPTLLLPSLTPTDTPVSMAVIVNGQGITLEEFEAELARYLMSDEVVGTSSDPEEAARVVLEDFVNQLLFVQAAAGLGYVVDNAALQAHIDALAADIGGNETLLAWQSEHGYTDEQFRQAMRRQMAVAWMRDQIISALPLEADQVHVRQILFNNEADAQAVYNLLKTGYDFITVAEQYNPITGGELGWFPRGYLVHPTIEEAAFNLEPGTYSTVVESSVGFHLLYLVERDPAHPLSPDARLVLQEKALSDWLTQHRNESTIVYPP